MTGEIAAPPPPVRASSPGVGILWMLVTGLCFVAVTAIVKHVGGRIPPVEAAFLRYLLGLVFILPMLGAMRRAHFSTRNLKLFGIRGFVHSIGVICWFFAMTQISIAEVTALNYMSPVYITLGAALFLGEALPPRRLAAVLCALAGALIILRPGIRALEAGHLAMVGTAMVFAVGYLIAKRMSSEMPASVIVAMLSVTVPVFLAPLAIAQWVTPNLTEVAWLFAVAFFATAGHYSMTRAFAAAPLTVTQPVTFLQLIWATALGALVFGEAVDIWVILGGALIIGAVTFIAWREAVAKRRKA